MKRIRIEYSRDGQVLAEYVTDDAYTPENIRSWEAWLNDSAVEHPGEPVDDDGYRISGLEFELLPADNQ